MSDRKAVNRYYPPDFDPRKHKSINKYRNSHPLRERARKLDQGILVIRFEMPYNIWCNGCGNHVGMGVRYNAEKKKVGKYYTTPIYQFKMKCHLCDNYYIIETDPQNCDYKILEGARRKNQKWDMADNEQVLTEDREVIKKRSRDPMYKLEHGVEDTKKLKTVIPTLSQIEDMQDAWKDDYMQNKMLRSKFREEKKSLKLSEEKDQALLSKSSLEITLVPENEDDKKLASLMKYNAAESFEDKQKHKREEIKNRPLFGSSTPPSTSTSSSAASSTNGNIAEIHKRLGLNKVKGRTGFGEDFDSPVGIRTNKLSTNLGIVVRKNKKAANNSDVIRDGNEKDNAIHGFSKVKGHSLGKVIGQDVGQDAPNRDEQFDSGDGVQDIVAIGSQSETSRTMQLEKSFQNKTGNEVGLDRTQDISASTNSVQSSVMTKSSISLCDYTSSSGDSD